MKLRITALSMFAITTGICSAVIALNFSGIAYEIEPATGIGFNLGFCGFGGMNSMATSSTAIFATNAQSSTAGNLYRVDPFFGTATFVAPLIHDTRAMTFVESTLYGVFDVGFGLPDQFGTIDPSTGAISIIGPMSSDRIQGMAADANGVVYAYDNGLGLLRVNVLTGATTDVNGTADGTGDIQTLEFGPTGILYGCRDQVFVINTTTGALSLVGGSGFNDVRGLAAKIDDRPISGIVELQDYEPGELGRYVEIAICNVGEIDPVETHYAELGADGEFSFQTMLLGQYDVTCKDSHWLRQRIANVEIESGGAFGLAFSLINGDADGDNEVTLVDVARVAAAFGSTIEDPNWDGDADFNGDEEVNLVDFAIASSNFGTAGDE